MLDDPFVSTLLPQKRRKHERGFALISTLWVVAILGVLALSLLALAHDGAITAHADLDAAQAEAYADGGVFLVFGEMLDRSRAGNIPVDGSARHIFIGDRNVEVSVQDENGKIDLNYTPKEILESLLATAGLSAAESSKVVDIIQDRRDKVLTDRTANDEGGLIPTFGGLAFHTTEQLKSVPGVSDDIFARVHSALTVYSRQMRVNTKTAPKEVLRALTGITDQKIEDILSERLTNPVAMGSVNRPVFAMDSSQNAMGTDNEAVSGVFTILATARVENSVFQRQAVVSLTRDAPQSLGILFWSVGSFRAFSDHMR